ncbi:MAG: hypothetical protein ACTSVE_10655, partial [Candidatus Helarchaeota archaeon]
IMLIPFFTLLYIFLEELIQKQFSQRELGLIATTLTGLIIVLPGFLVYSLITYLNKIYIATGLFTYGDGAIYFGYALFLGPIIYYLTKNSTASALFSAIYLALLLTSFPLNM